MPLSDNLVSYYSLEEASGTRADATGRGNDLTANNAPGNTTGIQANALALATASSQYLSRADSADHSMGDIDFSIAFWFYSTSGGSKGIVTKWQTGGNQREWWIGQLTSTINVFVSNNGSAAASLANGSAHSQTAWHFCVMWHDAAANTINVSVDNGTTASVAHSTGVFNGTAPFNIGAENGGVFFDGRVDEVGVWKRVLTSLERTELYNAGAGRDYTYITAAAGGQAHGKLFRASKLRGLVS